MRLRGLRGGGGGALFLSVSLSIKESEGNGDDGCVGESGQVLGQNGNTSFSSEEAVVVFEKGESETVRKGSGAMNTTKHLWSGAVAAMVSRFLLSKTITFLKKNSFFFWRVNDCLHLFVNWQRL